MISDVKHIFMYLLPICRSSLERCLFESFVHFFNGVFSFLSQIPLTMLEPESWLGCGMGHKKLITYKVMRRENRSHVSQRGEHFAHEMNTNHCVASNKKNLQATWLGFSLFPQERNGQI